MTSPAGGVVARLERELAAARAEVARLGRLLDLRGQDTAPAPEQLAVPAPTLVTNASSNQDKFALYTDRFRSRTAVYALRSENRWTGKPAEPRPRPSTARRTSIPGSSEPARGQTIGTRTDRPLFRPPRQRGCMVPEGSQPRHPQVWGAAASRWVTVGASPAWIVIVLNAIVIA